MVKTYKGCFAAVFIFIDFLVLLLCYSITQAPVLYYILAVVILLSSIFYIVYKLRPDLRDFLDDHVDIPFLYALVVLLCSIAFLLTEESLPGCAEQHRIYHEPAYPESEYIQTFRYQ